MKATVSAPVEDEVFLILFLIIVALVVALLLLFGAYRGIRNLLGHGGYHISDEGLLNSSGKIRR
ncbi:unnamed protein product [Gongylonema pulchrum]|uniref:Sgl0002 protein n=1 Tax=Gongylonema pulchrum TaxID=637853 RepID=A0A183DFX7_9BILA|nr:unnamed protein product [Gongylonema pulchrum]